VSKQHKPDAGITRQLTEFLPRSFHDGRHEDFAHIFEALMEKKIHDGYTDEYTAEFLPTCEDLV
jgi:hypothetical protein